MEKQFTKLETKPRSKKEQERLGKEAKKRAQHSYPHLHKIGH